MAERMGKLLGKRMQKHPYVSACNADAGGEQEAEQQGDGHA
jgi:hypothetical protein